MLLVCTCPLDQPPPCRYKKRPLTVPSTVLPLPVRQGASGPCQACDGSEQPRQQPALVPAALESDVQRNDLAPDMTNGTDADQRDIGSLTGWQAIANEVRQTTQVPALSQARQALAQCAACWGKWTPEMCLSRGAKRQHASGQLLVRVLTKRRSPEDALGNLVLRHCIMSGTVKELLAQFRLWVEGSGCAARCCAVTAAESSGVVQVMGEMDPDEMENVEKEANNGNTDAGHDIGSLTGWQAIAAGVRLVHCSHCVHLSSVRRRCQHGNVSVCCVHWGVSRFVPGLARLNAQWTQADMNAYF